jgi:hypothetical protein
VELCQYVSEANKVNGKVEKQLKEGFDVKYIINSCECFVHLQQ